jgi:hypothetical protein
MRDPTRLLYWEDFMRSLILLTVCVGIGAGCGKRVPEPTGLPPGTPHVSWIIMSGDRDEPDRDFICQSDPRNECAIPASKPGAQVFSDLHFYYHGAGAETRYTGTIQIGFFEGAPESHAVHPSVTVKNNESITNQSIVGAVSSKPGTYVIKLDLVATVMDGGKSQAIQTEVPVAVK